ncbi:hypothetical protein TWF694_009687 [Orbilia ellipsospora]|uniref:DUF4139 domain-containing protein n=1 Tax=Orbilia ellipsospora TaxID=2528407 RepID=A0AAV9XCE2_9PEZI
MARDPETSTSIKGKEAEVVKESTAAGTFEDPHKLVFDIKDLCANSVVLYPDQAQITRDIDNVHLQTGVNEITIKNLTGWCQEHSIKVEGKGDAIITDMVVENVMRPIPYTGWFGQPPQNNTPSSDDEDEESQQESESESDLDPEDDPDFSEVRAINEQIRDIRLQIDDAQEEVKNAETQLAALERYGATITAEWAQPEIMTQFLDAYQQNRKILYAQNKTAKLNLSNLQKELAKKEKEKLKTAKKPTAAKAKIAKQKAKERSKKDEAKREKLAQKNANMSLRPNHSYRVKVMVEANADTEASLTLIYLVNNAQWYPRYDLRLDSIAKTGQVIYRAHFENKTYETWRDAKITFSSSAQTFGGLREMVPSLAPWTLSLSKGQNANSEDNTAGLYSIKEQQELAKKGVMFGNKNARNKMNAQQGHILNDYQMKLMLLEQQNKKRLMMARRDDPQILHSQSNSPAQQQALFNQQQVLGNQLQAQAQQQQQQQQKHLARQQMVNNQRPSQQHYQQIQQQQQQDIVQAQAHVPSNIALSNAAGLFGGGAFGASTLGDMPLQPQTAPAPTGFGAAATGFGAAVATGFSEKPENESSDDDEASTLAPARNAMLVAESSSSESYGMTTTYDISGFKTIKSSPLVRRQVIGTIDIPAVNFTSVAVAKLRSAAFLKARFKNTSKHTFLRGTAGLTVDGSFLGQTTIPHCPPDDTISLSLGVDTGVHVSYAKPTLVSSSQGFISKENVTTFKRSIFIHNAKAQMLTLTVLDQVPVSEDERLRVNVVNPKGLREGGEAVKTGTPGAQNLNDKWGTAMAVMKVAGNGEVSYTVKLEKGRSCKLPLEYEVKLPAGEKIWGLT